MLRFGVAFGLAICLGSSTAAFAQAPGQGPPMPLAMDLAKVPVSSWADYHMVMGNQPPMKMRLALVAKSAAGNSIETTLEGGLMAMVGKMVVHMELGQGVDASLKRAMVQLGAGDPMEMPLQMSGPKPFTKPNPKALVGSETLKVPAGSFKTKHYREKTPEGDKLDYWVSEIVPPFGLVKVEVDQKNHPAQPGKPGGDAGKGGRDAGKLTFELTAIGKDAKQVVTKPPKPFDRAALMQQMMSAGAGGLGGPGAPKPVPPPPPPPPKK